MTVPTGVHISLEVECRAACVCLQQDDCAVIHRCCDSLTDDAVADIIALLK